MSYSVESCKSEQTLKGYLGQLADVKAARMLINCRLRLLTCVRACVCVCVCVYKGAFCIMAFFFLLLYSYIPLQIIFHFSFC